MQDVTLFGELRCPKTRFYQALLDERGVEYELAEVDRDAAAARRLTDLTGSRTKFPTFSIKGRKVRNPKPEDLDKELARAGLHDPGLVHDENSQRFIRHMAPRDAFVSYSWQGDRMVLGHIEIDPSLRGSGLGGRFATEVLTHLENAPHEIRLTCPFLRRVGRTRSEWREKFNLKED
ncbi:N-acetyltransferase [Epibacterium sp. DP7N7-1]|nr:N-acetyltransferase [Epibacterium sp. DP7N7-1]